MNEKTSARLLNDNNAQRRPRLPRFVVPTVDNTAVGNNGVVLVEGVVTLKQIFKARNINAKECDVVSIILAYKYVTDDALVWRRLVYRGGCNTPAGLALALTKSMALSGAIDKV